MNKKASVPASYRRWKTAGDMRMEIEEFYESCINREWILNYDINGVAYKKQRLMWVKRYTLGALAEHLGIHSNFLSASRFWGDDYESVFLSAKKKSFYQGIMVRWTRTIWPLGTETRKTSRAIQKRLYDTVEEFIEIVNTYFDSCLSRRWEMKKGANGEEYRQEFVQQIKPYTMSGLCVFLGISHASLSRIKKRGPKFEEVITYARMKCEAYAEEFLFSGKSAQGSMFVLKNRYGWHDTRREEISGIDGQEINISVNDEKAQQARNTLLLLTAKKNDI